MSDVTEEKSTTPPVVTKSKSNHDDVPLQTKEFNITYIKRNSKSKLLYDTFDTEYNNYLIKLSDTQCKKVCNLLSTKKKTYLGYKPKTTQKTYTFGSASISSSKKLRAIILDVNDLDINVGTGETPNIDMCIYITYFQYIRAAIYTQFVDIKNDKSYINLIIQWLISIYMRGFKFSPLSSLKEKNLLRITVAYFFHRFGLIKEHSLALELALNSYDKLDAAKEFKSEFDLFKKYKSMVDIFKAFKDVNIISGNETIANAMINFIKHYQIYGYYNILSSSDVIIATCIVSLYPTRQFSNMLIDKQLQTKIEKLTNQYTKKVKLES